MKSFILYFLLFTSFSTYSQSIKTYLAYTELSHNKLLFNDTINNPIIKPVHIDSNIPSSNQNERKNKFGAIFFESLDFLYNDFSDFESILGSYNIENMKKSRNIFITEIAGIYKRYYLGISCGYNHDDYNKHDSLDIEFNTTQFGLHLGYNLIDSKRFLITPKVALKWNRYRLINNNNEDKIPIEQYINERDLDLRFHQLTGFIGLNLSLKLYNFNIEHTDYWTIGLYGGYLFKINNNSLVYSSKNRLTTNREIGIKDYNIGIYISYNFDSNYKD